MLIPFIHLKGVCNTNVLNEANLHQKVNLDQNVYFVLKCKVFVVLEILLIIIRHLWISS